MDQDSVSDTPEMMIERLSTMVRDVWPSLHEQGIGPDRDTIVSVAAVGLVEKTWRNSPVEDAHASRRGPNDGEMMAQSLHLHTVACGDDGAEPPSPHGGVR